MLFAALVAGCAAWPLGDDLRATPLRLQGAGAPDAAKSTADAKKPADATSPAKGDGQKNPAEAKSADERKGWARLRAHLEKRSADERVRLAKLLEPRLADLGLDYLSRDNRDYLDREFDKIARLDPDIAAVLVPMLAPKADEGASRNRADNARRILDRFDLTPYQRELRQLADDAPSRWGRLRALRLLAKTKHPERLALLDSALKNTPEVYVPALLAAIGESGQHELVARVVPFLGRPSEVQRLAALRALAKLGSPTAIVACTKAAVDLASDVGYESLLALLEATLEDLDAKYRPDFARALRETLVRAESLDKKDAMRAVDLVAALPRDGLGDTGPALDSALLGLVEHPSTDVQFRAARILQDRGDKRAVKKILGRLDEFVRNNKKVPYAWQQRALAHRAFGNPKAALKDINQAIKLSPTADPRLHFLAAELEIARKAATAVLRHLRAADASAVELERFRAAHPAIESLLERNRQLRRLFGAN